MYSTTSNRCISAAYACFADHADAKSVLTVLLMVAAIATTLIFHLWSRNGQTDQVTTVGINPGEETKIYIPSTLIPLAQLHKKPQLQVLETSSSMGGLSPDLTNEGKKTVVKISGNETTIDILRPVPPVVVPLFKTFQVPDTSSGLVGLSPTLTDEVDSNLNASLRDQSVVDTSDSASLLHQTPIETSSFHIEQDLLTEGQQTSPGVANHGSGMPSQPSQQPSPPAVTATVAAENAAQIPDLNTEFKVATWVSMISAGAIVSVISGLIGNEKATLTHKILFKAFSTLNYVSLVLGVGLFLLSLTRPNIPGLVTIAKFIMWIAIGSITYALGCATCLLLPQLVVVVLVLVAPLVMACLIVALGFGCRN